MNKKMILPALGAGVAIGFAGIKYFENMDFNKRCDTCSRVFQKSISLISKNLPYPEAQKSVDVNKNFSDGNSKIISEPSKNPCWSLGYSKISIIPDDINTKKYCIGGNTRLPANYVKGVESDIFVRTTALNDGNGRGTVVFCSVDCIGISNKNIRAVRERMSGYCREKNIASLNILSVHCHSAVDTCGIWGEIIDVMKHNRKVLKTGKGELKNSCDEEYTEFLYGVIEKSVKNAVDDMCEGKLYKSYMGKNSYAPFKNAKGDMSVTDYGLAGFVWDRRKPFDCSTQLLRLHFVPNDTERKETYIVNFAAHPYTASLKVKGKGNGDKISGDFVYYMDEVFNEYGANMQFINGAVAAVYPIRPYPDKLDLYGQARAFGEEVGRIALSMSKSKNEINENSVLSPDKYEEKLGFFTDGKVSRYREWLNKKGDGLVKEAELVPDLKISLVNVPIKVDNPVFHAVGKLNIGNYNIISDGKGFSSFTEVGYLEIGGEVKAALIPGELEPALLSGSYACEKEYSYSKTEFSGIPLCRLAYDSSLCVFGLCNDAIGYIIPDNDFSMMFLGTGKKMNKLFGNHYLEIFSFGKNTARSITDGFDKAYINLKKEKNNEI